MGRFKSTYIPFEDEQQLVESLISRARHHAQTNRAYSMEIIAHLQDHAYEYDDNALFNACRELMSVVMSASPYPPRPLHERAGDDCNFPKTEAAEDVAYDSRLDGIFDEQVKVSKVKAALDQLSFRKTGRVEWYVVFRVLLHLRWLKDTCEQKDFLSWVNLQYHCGWEKKHHFTFSRDVHKSLRDQDVSRWNAISTREYTKGYVYYNFAVQLRNTFQTIIVNGLESRTPVTDFSLGKNRDKAIFMVRSNQLINWGK